MAAEVILLHNYNHPHNKFYGVRVDLIPGSALPYRVVAAWGPVSRPKAQSEQIKGEYPNLLQAKKLAETLANDKYHGGYTYITASDYKGGCTADQLMAKMDMSRCVGDDVMTVNMPIPTDAKNPFHGQKPAPKPTRPKPAAAAPTERSRRSLMLFSEE